MVLSGMVLSAAFIGYGADGVADLHADRSPGPIANEFRHLSLPTTGVTFRTDNKNLQMIFDRAELRARSNVVRITDSRPILVEGGGYTAAWLETQPLGGEMYATRDVVAALNNQLIFMLTQRRDGRLPGMVFSSDQPERLKGKKRRLSEAPDALGYFPALDLWADYGHLQGCYLPDPAWKIYFWIGEDRRYLEQLYECLQAFDAYLWRTRDSDGDGVLETWCTWDTGEDHSTRYLLRWAPSLWPFDVPPGSDRAPDPNLTEVFKRYWVELSGEKSGFKSDEIQVPFGSMDLMGWSFDIRTTLSKIARQLNHESAETWQRAAEDVRQVSIAKLYVPELHACFDRDRGGRRLPELIHNNLRAMYHGLFSQEMADDFIRYHLLNPQEFWTSLPLPSIAANDPLYQNAPGNNWSGQPQGLTYQRALRALENYGHHAEVTMLGQAFLSVLARPGSRFAQQYDPSTGEAASSSPELDNYGPSLLAALEYVSRLHGVHLDVERGEVWWSVVKDQYDYTYTQTWGQNVWKLESNAGQVTGSLNGRQLFTARQGARVVTDLNGTFRAVVGIETAAIDYEIKFEKWQFQCLVKPNRVYARAADSLREIASVRFDYPFQEKPRENP